MISVNDFQNGMTIVLDGTVYQIMEFQHFKMGRGGAMVRTKLKDVKEGRVIEKTFRGGEKIERAHVQGREHQFLYREGDNFIFMDMETFEQISLGSDLMGDSINYLKENMNITVTMYEGKPIGIELPLTVELEVVETPPGIRGNTVSGGSKPATLETGAVVQVPLFINVGDVIQVDTRTGEYLTRV